MTRTDDVGVLAIIRTPLAQEPEHRCVVEKWASVRNCSDPTTNSYLDAKQQEDCASHIYLKYGYWTSVLGAIATWSIIAGLP